MLGMHLCLVNSDQGKHGSALKNLNSQKSLKNDHFPKKIADGKSMLSNNDFDKSFDKNKKKRTKMKTRLKKTPLRSHLPSLRFPVGVVARKDTSRPRTT